MNLAELSIKRPIFVSCVVFVLLTLGWMSFKRMPVDLFPDISFPVVMVSTPYPGASPNEIETLISKPLEEEISGISGIETLNSISKEGVSVVYVKFRLKTDIKDAEQQVRARVASARLKFPEDAKESMIRRIDPSAHPVAILALSTDQVGPAELYDLAEEKIKPKIEQVDQVGLVEILGGRKREIKVELDREKLKARELSVTSVAERLSISGQNIPAGKVSESKTETVFRTLGEFKSIQEIESSLVNFLGNDVPIRLSQVGDVTDSLEDETSRAYVNGSQSLLLFIFRQTGSNTIQVVDSVFKATEKINESLKHEKGAPNVHVVYDGAKPIRANVTDVRESILLGILLTILVVFFFLGNARSTFITGLALPTSLIGAFFLMDGAGFSVNIMTLLALSLSVGLVIDDAIVVRENIFRHLEKGSPGTVAALVGTKEVTMAVIATTLTVIAVFGPVSFLDGIVGQFFKEFGLTICFAMAISLFDAFTMAPMLSAYFAARSHSNETPWGRFLGNPVKRFQKFQDHLEIFYDKTLKIVVVKPILAIGGASLILLLSIVALVFIPKTFLPPQDFGEFSYSVDLPSGTNLERTNEVSLQIDELLRSNPEVENSVLTVGGRDGEANVAQAFIRLVPANERSVNTSQFKDRFREQLKPFAFANPKVKDIDMVSGGQRPFNLNIVGPHMSELQNTAHLVLEKLKDHPGLRDVDMNFKSGKPELQIKLEQNKAARLGVSSVFIGQELRNQVEGAVPAKFREEGKEYDIRVRLKEHQRNLKEDFGSIFVPNINSRLIRLTDVAEPVEAYGPSNINRQDRGRYIQINADMAPHGPGIGGVMADINKMFKEEIPLPPTVSYRFVGQAEDFKELMENMLLAAGLAILFIYLILASLYESFVIPFTIMLVVPLAACGAFLALFVTGRSIDIFSLIGCIMLLGLAMKNSILLVDLTNQLVNEGKDRTLAIIQAGRTRLRPILMTTVALISGMLPIALGLNEASKQRTSMGIAVIGGLISSTILSLVVVPASYTYIDNFRIWSKKLMKSLFMKDTFKDE